MRGEKHGSRQQLQSKGRMHGGSTQVTHTSHTSLMAERELETFGSGRGRRRGEKHGSHAPPSVRPPSKAAPAPCHLPARPFLWLYFRSFIPILFQAAPTDLYFIANFYTHMTTFGVCHFLPRQVGAAGNIRQQRWFRSRRQRLYFRLAGATCRLITGTKRCNCFLRVVVSFINIGIDLYLDSIH